MLSTVRICPPGRGLGAGSNDSCSFAIRNSRGFFFVTQFLAEHTVYVHPSERRQALISENYQLIILHLYYGAVKRSSA